MALTVRALNNTGAPIYGPSGSLAPDGTQISFTLIRPPGTKTVGDAWDATTGERVGGTITTTTTSGLFTVNLWPNDRGNVVTQYLCRVNLKGAFVDFLGAIPSGSGAYSWVNFYSNGVPLTPTEISLLATHISDMTVHLTPAQNTLLDGLNATLTAAELNFVDGVTSAIQTQIDGKQPLDATLTALAGVVTAADTMEYFTGVDAAASTPLTAFARTLLDDANAAAALATLGAVGSSAITLAASRVAGRGSAGGTGLIEALIPQAPFFINGTDLTTQVSQPCVIGRSTAGSGTVGEITTVAPFSLAGGQFTSSMATKKLIGRGTAGTGVMEEITLGTNLTLAGTTLNGPATVTTTDKLTTADMIPDFVASGITAATSGTLSTTITAGAAYVGGVRAEPISTPNTYTASRDTYVDLADTGAYTFVDVANGAGEPALTSGNLRVLKVVTSAGAVTGVSAYYRDNVFIGALAGGTGNRGGIENVGLGQDSLANLTTGVQNIAIGQGVGGEITSESRNVMVGHSAMRLAAGAEDCVALGYNAMVEVAGDSNVAVGSSAGVDLDSGASNTLVGNGAGTGITTGSGNTVIGSGAGTLSASLANNIVLSAGDGIHAQSDAVTFDFRDPVKVPVTDETNIYTAFPPTKDGMIVLVSDGGPPCLGYSYAGDWYRSHDGTII